MKKYKAEDYRIIVYEPAEKEGFIAEIEELAAIGDGASREEAIADLLNVANEKLSIAYDLVAHVNPPERKASESGYSGKILLRLPKTLHRLIAKQAERENCSINQLMLSYISFGLGSEQNEESKSNKIEKLQKVERECAYKNISLVSQKSNWVEYSSKAIGEFIHLEDINFKNADFDIIADKGSEIEKQIKMEFEKKENLNKANNTRRYLQEIMQNNNKKNMEGLFC